VPASALRPNTWFRHVTALPEIGHSFSLRHAAAFVVLYLADNILAGAVFPASLLSTDGNCYEKARGDPRSNPGMGCGSHSRDGQRPWG
jgi:hypothetical protein